MKSRLALAIAGCVALAGCMVGPKYKRPSLPIPSTYRGETTTAAAGTASFGALKWSEVFHDPVLENLIRTALIQNYDLKIAAARILQAEGQLRVTHANQLPQVNGTGGVTEQRIYFAPSFPGFKFTQYHLGGAASWLLDFWGQYRRATEAARAALLASRDNQQAVRVTLVSEVASAYFQLRALDLELQISEDTLKSRQVSFHLTQIKEQGGVSSMLDVRQAQSLVETAETTITDTNRLITQQEDAISILLGENPRAIPRGLPLNAETLAPQLPPGLPSSLLERRPDIRIAEEQLVAANAQIGVARAQLFPQVALTGSAGGESFQLAQLFSNGIWSIAGNLTQPIFEGGALRGNLQAVRAEEQEAVLTYKKAVQEAFREVSDALVAYQRDRKFLAEQQELTKTLADADHIARLQYQGGVTTYLDVLTQETQYFNAQLGAAQAKYNELASVVELYQALGGGWQQ
ncbi:MAG: efflux transporter outer membrane subunit [Terriglobia bacterium]